ncbi:MAG: hypothetical protein EAS48_03845 [Chryseobacterium sp.]|nr:MAG: hypothetical protein EAS48_03845 [Chryseobacterium sp.]
MKGILKIYHPDETLKYNIQQTYCKAVYQNSENFLELEVITSDDLDHVDDDSLQYNFPQLALNISEFPIGDNKLDGKTFLISDTADDIFTEVDLFDDEDALLYDNELSFSTCPTDGLQLTWKGMIDDFYTSSGEKIPFRLKCHFKQDEIPVED